MSLCYVNVYITICMCVCVISSVWMIYCCWHGHMVPSLHLAKETNPLKIKATELFFFNLMSKLDFQPVMTEKMLGYLQAFFSSSRSSWWCFTTWFLSFCGQPKCQRACRNSFSWPRKCSMRGALVARYCRFDYWFLLQLLLGSDRWHTKQRAGDLRSTSCT